MKYLTHGLIRGANLPALFKVRLILPYFPNLPELCASTNTEIMTVRHLSKDNVDYWIGIPSYPVNLFVSYFMVCNGRPTFSEEFLFPNNNAEVFFNLGDVNNGLLHENSTPFVFRDTI